MNRISSNQYYLTTIRISILMCWLLGFLYLILITGCAVPAAPHKSDLKIHENTQIPNISLVRRVVPEVGKEYRERHPMFSSNYYADVESKSRFGEPDEDANLICIYTGLKESLPDINIVPTTTFWEQVVPLRNHIELSELFFGPQSDQFRALQADVIVIAYHSRIDLENTKMEVLIEGAFDNKDKETAAIIVVDPNRKSIIHGSRITFEDSYFFYHFLIFPVFWAYTSDPPDLCETIAREAGLAIAEAIPGRPISVLAVAAGEDPFTSAKDQYNAIRYGSKGAAEWDKLKQLQEEELLQLAPEDELLQLAPDELLRQAKHGNANAQLVLFKDLHTKKPNEALIWLCRSTTLGNREAKVILAEIYEHGGYSWIKKGIVERNYKLAYVWYALSGIYDQEVLQFFADLYLTSEERLDAEKMLKEWQPGNCERELGLVRDELNNKN